MSIIEKINSSADIKQLSRAELHELCAELRRFEIENIAQTCAARIGWLNRDKPIPNGVIGAVNNFEHTANPAAGETITTTVTVTASVFEAIIVHAEIHCVGQPIAQCDMKVFVRPIEN